MSKFISLIAVVVCIAMPQESVAQVHADGGPESTLSVAQVHADGGPESTLSVAQVHAEQQTGLTPARHRHAPAQQTGLTPARHRHAPAQQTGLTPARHRHAPAQQTGLTPARHRHAPAGGPESTLSVAQVHALFGNPEIDVSYLNDAEVSGLNGGIKGQLTKKALEALLRQMRKSLDKCIGSRACEEISTIIVVPGLVNLGFTIAGANDWDNFIASTASIAAGTGAYIITYRVIHGILVSAAVRKSSLDKLKSIDISSKNYLFTSGLIGVGVGAAVLNVSESFINDLFSKTDAEEIYVMRFNNGSIVVGAIAEAMYNAVKAHQDAAARNALGENTVYIGAGVYASSNSHYVYSTEDRKYYHLGSCWNFYGCGDRLRPKPGRDDISDLSISSRMSSLRGSGF